MGRHGWTDAERAKFAATIAARPPDWKPKPRRVPPEWEARLAALEGQVADLLARPEPSATIRVVEWRPDHTRHKDGGRPVREQRRHVGLPKRPRKVA